MLTKWAKNALRASLSMWRTPTTSLRIKNTANAWIQVNGVSHGSSSWSSHGLYVPYVGDSSTDINIRQNYYGSGFVIGSGSTQPTEYDYKLEQMITSGFSSAVLAFDQSDANGNPGAKFQFTITNTSNEPITISEIGTLGYCNQVSNGNVLLVDRTLLNTPITIQPGDFAIIVYELYVDISDLTNLT